MDGFAKAFYMVRKYDETGRSGVGRVLDGVIFPDGTTVVHWYKKDKPTSTAIYSTYEDFEYLHIKSHPGNGTIIRWCPSGLEKKVLEE